MKKTLLGLAVSSLFVVGAAQAVNSANDGTATLAVSGTVTSSQSICAVSLGQSTVILNGDISNMEAQGDDATPPTTIDLSITGDDQCTTLVKQGKMVYKFQGTADGIHANVLANAATGADAASGVGIGLYNMAGKVIALNQNTLAASETGTQFRMGLVKLDYQTPVAGKVQGALTVQIERL